MEAVFGIVKKHGANFTSDQAMEVLKNWKSPDTPAGPIAIDPATRDIIHEVSIAKIEKKGDKFENVAFDVVKDVKDPWKQANPEK